jgi:tRNA threonylcarbamoyl adenosine modification protein YeaZ
VHGEATAGLGCSGEAIETGAHVTDALGLVEAALRQAQLDRGQVECLAIGLGPGSYTGIRLAIALAQGWQLATPVKLLGISSAECLAAQAQAEGIVGQVGIVIDAQRNEFYFAVYDVGPGARREIEPLRLATFAEVQARQQAGARLIGPEVTKWFPGGRLVSPRAATLGQLALDRADFVPGERLEPIYLRETRFVKAPPPRMLG